MKQGLQIFAHANIIIIPPADLRISTTSISKPGMAPDSLEGHYKSRDACLVIVKTSLAQQC